MVYRANGLFSAASCLRCLSTSVEHFRDMALHTYGLDPVHYFTLPGFAWDALLKTTKASLELLTDVDMHNFVESGMRGGITMVSHRHVNANNPEVKEYDDSNELIPAILRRPVNAQERNLLTLPCRFGGLGLPNPSSRASQHQSSRALTAPLTSLILSQNNIMRLGTAIHDVRTVKKQVKVVADASIRTEAVLLSSSSADAELQWVIALASEKGASSWLTCRPLKRHGLSLTKGEFRDGIHLRYGWLPQRLPSSCSCGATFTEAHTLSCPTGGFPSVWHNEVRDLTASMLKRVAHNVSVKPHLQQVTGEQFRHRSAIQTDQARLDVAASGIWGGGFERTYIDVRVFNPHALSN